jgi:hypothetical protein
LSPERAEWLLQELAILHRIMEEQMRGEGREQGLKEGHRQGIRIGKVQGLQRILLRQLRLKFGRVPRALEQTIQATENLRRLRTWLDRVVTAKSLGGLRIPAGKRR